MIGVNFSNNRFDVQFIPADWPGMTLMIKHDTLEGSVSANLVETAKIKEQHGFEIAGDPTFSYIEFTDVDGDKVIITPNISNFGVVTLIKDMRYGQYHADIITRQSVYELYGKEIYTMLDSVTGINMSVN